jgi:hypothetical protein
MQDYREIDRIRKDFVAVRSLAKRLLELPQAGWNEWEIDFLQHMARHKGPDPITTRQGEKLIELRDDAKYYSSVHGFSVQSLIKNCWVAALGNLLRDPNWLLGSGFCRSRCWLGYHNRIGNRLRNIDGFRAGLMSMNHERPP